MPMKWSWRGNPFTLYAYIHKSIGHRTIQHTNYHRDMTHHPGSHNGNVKIIAAKATNWFILSCHLLLESLSLLPRQNPFPELLPGANQLSLRETLWTCTWGKVWAKLELRGWNSGDWWQTAWFEWELMGRAEHTDVHPGDMEEKLQWQGKDTDTVKREEAARCGMWPSESCGGWECQLKREAPFQEQRNAFLFNSCCLIAPSNGI